MLTVAAFNGYSRLFINLQLSKLFNKNKLCGTRVTIILSTDNFFKFCGIVL
jgi:hypothetical protein